MGVGKSQVLNALDVGKSFRRGCVDTSVRTTGQDEHVFCVFWLEKVFCCCCVVGVIISFSLVTN